MESDLSDSKIILKVEIPEIETTEGPSAADNFTQRPRTASSCSSTSDLPAAKRPRGRPPLSAKNAKAPTRPCMCNNVILIEMNDIYLC
jgi:hypothetical protein